VDARCGDATASDGAQVPVRADELLAATSADRTDPHVVAAGSSIHRALGVLDRVAVVVVPMHTQGSRAASH
jgi:hypothetical protein